MQLPFILLLALGFVACATPIRPNGKCLIGAEEFLVLTI